MPNFNTHWMVALKACDAAPLDIRNGLTQYRMLTNKFTTSLIR